ncbi:MAG: hypothetical protein V1829_01180 [bacterium]
MIISPSQIKKIQNIAEPLIKQRYIKCFSLPQDLRQTIFAVETSDKMIKAADKNNLNTNQTWSASYIVGMVLLGETHITDFVKTLQQKCQLAEEPARALARDINQLIFLPVKESLKKIHKVSEWPRENQTEQAIPKPVPIQTPPAPKINGNIVDLKR